MRKEDRRNIYTENVIRDALFELLSKKPIERISVTEVCKKAGINRSTFYLHYKDCFHVLEKEQKKLCTKLIDYITQTKSEPLDIIRALHQITLEDHDIYLIMLRDAHPFQAFSSFTDYCRKYLIAEMQKNCGLTESECDLVAQYIIAGAFATAALFAEETEYDPTRNEIIHNVIFGGFSELSKKYPKRQ